ncbi:MAG: adenylate/guanylate cyclase domain-containing protein [Pseudomonadota bacterium]
MALSSKKSQHLAGLIGLVSVVLILAVQTGKVPVLDTVYKRLELFVYNLRMQAHLPQEVDPEQRIVIVEIDEYSLRKEGHWPWSRHRIANLVERLAEAGTVVVAFDILFAEAERNPIETILSRLRGKARLETVEQRLHELAPAMDADAYLAEHLSNVDVILGYTFDNHRNAVSGQLPMPLPLANPEVVGELVLPAKAGYTAPLPVLTRAAAGAGFFSLHSNVDIDGVIRRAPLIARYDGKLYGSLALETVKRYMFLQQVELVTGAINDSEHIEFVKMDKAVTVPTDGEGRMLIPFRGEARSFPYVSAHDVLAGRADPELFAGAIVLVGATAAGLYDMRTTPVDAVYPGVEIHANMVAAMLDERYLVVPSWAEGANLVLGSILGLILALVMPRLTLLWLLVFTFSSVGAVIAVTGWFWGRQGLVLDLAGPLMIIAILSVGNLTWGFFFESITRHRLKGMFGQYVPPELVDAMSERPDEFDVEGRARELSVLFSDIRGFTTISESLSADELKRFLNRFFTPMTRLIFQRRGTIDKYVGDMVMAFWGAPVKDEEHAVHAIEAALDMQREAQRLNAEFIRAGRPEVSIGIGINSGMMSVGDMGSEYRRTYTVIGDAVNLAARLEGTTKYYGTGLVIGERTRELAGDRFIYRELDKVRVKGKAQAIRIFEPLCRREEATEQLVQELEILEKALAAYRKRRWDEAAPLFGGLVSLRPDVKIYSLYVERIAELRQCDPGDDWGGVHVFTEK